MKRDCPTIQELLAFDAVARYESVSKAAEVLCLTVSAVSKQLAGLELFMGQRLLEKRGRGVQLTPLGQLYWQKIATSLRMIEAATFEVRSNAADSGVLSLACVPTFLTKWLIPRLPEFYQQWPDIDIQLAVAAPMQDKPERHDVDIRFGKPPFDDRLSIKLFDDQLLVLAAPSYLSRRPLSCPTDLVQAELLRSPLVPWQPWMVAAGLEPREPGRGASFTDLGFLLEAAASGLGVAICPGRLAQHWQENGQLVALFDVAVASESTYYALVNRAAAQRPEVEAFLDWLGTTFA